MSATWVLDWAKIRTVEDVVQLLKACDLHPRPDHIDFEHLRPFCKLIDDDGREVTQPALGVGDSSDQSIG